MDFYFETDQPLELGPVAQKLDGNIQAIRLAKFRQLERNTPIAPKATGILGLKRNNLVRFHQVV